MIEHLLGASDIRAIAERLGVRPTKQWGQNFVIDGNTVRRIVNAAGITADDVVVEVGPGLGSLTLALLQQAQRVIAVEVDPVLAGELAHTVKDRLPSLNDKLDVINADALQISELPDRPTALVSNLPYNVAVPVLITMLTRFDSINRVLVMVQAEVADRLAAAPGSKTYGVPSVKAQWFGTVKRAGSIGRNVFWPAPNVDSGLVLIERTAPPQTSATRAQVFAVIDAAFGQRRKTLRSALGALIPSAAVIDEALARADVDPKVRGEVLTVSDFARLTEALIFAGAVIGSSS